LRTRVNKNQDIAADKMTRNHDKKRNKVSMEFKVGDNVTVYIPPIDRANGDMPRLPCKVVRECGTENKMYELARVCGIIEIKYGASDLELQSEFYLFFI
jgi:hypothetical protein